MKIKKYNEELTDYSTHKEYDEYSHIDINIINEWNKNISEINNFISYFTHEIKIHSQFIKEYVICDNRNIIIIPSDIKLIYDDKILKTVFFDIHTKINIKSTNVKYIKTIDDVANSDQKLFLELYETYIKNHKAPYMDVFGRDEFKHILDTINYNI